MHNELGAPLPPIVPSTIVHAVRAALRPRHRSLVGCLAAGLASYGPTAFADAFPPVVELAELDGTDGFVINAGVAGEGLGGAVSDAGDVDGDGFDDFTLGAVDAAYPRTEGGANYIVLGGPDVGSQGSFELSTLDGANGFRILNVSEPVEFGALYFGFGRDVSAAGDLNGDGFDDVAVIASGSDHFTGYAGATWVVFGGDDGFPETVVNWMLDGTDGFISRPHGTDASGVGSVSDVGDVNGDGFDDLIIGTPARIDGPSKGGSYVLFGGPNIADTVHDAFDGTSGFVLNGLAEGDRAGIGTSGAGDMNGDGFADLVMTASNAPGGDAEGRVYVVFGAPAVGRDGTFDLASLDGSNGFVLEGTPTGAVSLEGDVNGDGLADLVLGDTGANINGTVPGAVYVVFGRAKGFPASFAVSSLDGSNGYVIAAAASSGVGASVDVAEDVSGDGIDDIVIGAPQVQPDRRGASYVVFGGRNVGASGLVALSSLDGTNGFAIEGAVAGDGTGRAVSGAGDVNGDGLGDIVIGAPLDGSGGTPRTGASYVVFGKSAAETLHIEIDIEPSNPNNVVRPVTRGNVRVALLSSTSLPFDALQVDVGSLRFGPNKALSLHEVVRDVNRDGLGDLVATFWLPATGIGCGDFRAELVARTHDGVRVHGSDRIRTAGCR